MQWQHILIIIIPSLNLSLLVIIGSVEDRSAPLTQQTLGDPLDTRLGLLTSSVEDDDLSDATAEECFLLNVHLSKSVKNVSLDVVRR